MSILNLAPAPEFAVGALLTLPRRSLTVSSETVEATVERVRKGSSEYIYTLQIAGKYPHWRVLTESMLRQNLRMAGKTRLQLIAA